MRFVQQQFFLARAGLADIDGRPQTLFRAFAAEHQVHVARALELLVDDVVHAAAGVDQNGGDDGQRAAVFEIAGRAEQLPRNIHGIGAQPPGQRAAVALRLGVEGARHAGQGVDEDHGVATGFSAPDGGVHGQADDAHVLRHALVRRGVEHPGAAQPSFEIGHLLGTFVDQQHENDRVLVVGGDGVRHVF